MFSVSSFLETSPNPGVCHQRKTKSLPVPLKLQSGIKPTQVIQDLQMQAF